MTNYTKEETRTINKAYSRLSNLAETFGLSYRMRSAFRLDRAERGDATATKACLVAAAIDGANKIDLDTLTSYAEGCVYAVLVGARLRYECEGHPTFAAEWQAFILAASESAQAQSARINRALDTVKGA